MNDVRIIPAVFLSLEHRPCLTAYGYPNASLALGPLESWMPLGAPESFREGWTKMNFMKILSYEETKTEKKNVKFAVYLNKLKMLYDM